MGLTKTENYTKSQNDLALFTKALGHPARIAILQFFDKDKVMCLRRYSGRTSVIPINGFPAPE